ncbi:MAG: serine/threonine protein kinase, partial [Pseudonocardia sp.]|nr:serine/threonine protein kinase [Pseudonocardia sp.]
MNGEPGGVERFGPYELVSLLGRGGMGEVFRAYDTVRRRTVALKRLPRHLAGDRDYEARFRREAEVAARLTEPHIIPIHDYGEIDGRLYIDMRLITGTDLADVIRDSGPLPAARAVAVIGQVATALAAAHAEGLVHRDVKPSNVLISPTDRGEDFVHLVDFGIVHERNTTALTATGSTVGTVDYMAPERLQQEECDHRVDVYSLGCILFEALTGAKPFPAASTAAKMFAHMHTPPPRPSQQRAGIPPGLDDVVAQAMAKDPG